MKNNKIKIILTIFYFICLPVIVGCAGPSLREQSIVRGLPEIYRNHNTGFILSPTKRKMTRGQPLKLSLIIPNSRADPT